MNGIPQLEKEAASTVNQPEKFRLAEVISALSYALDITEGQPEGHAIKSCLIGMKIAEVIGLPESQRPALFYALLLKDLGCSSNAAKMCWLFEADDRSVKKNIKTTDWTSLFHNGIFAFQNVKPGASFFEKLKTVFGLATKSNEEGRKLIKTRCERGADIVRMLGFPDETANAILCLDEHWIGNGHPLGLKGDQISLLGRICCLAQTLEVFHSTGGSQLAIQIANRRRKTWFDPELVDAIVSIRNDQAFWATLSQTNLQQHLGSLLNADQVQHVDELQLDKIANAFAQVVDAKSPWTHRHSEGVATIAKKLAAEMGFSVNKQSEIHRAGLLHDIGKLGVSNLILDKPGKLTDEEYSLMKMHAEHSSRILSRVSCFSSFAKYAAAHHERIDGNGYFLGLGGEDLSVEARILAVADVAEALSAKRPYRDGMPAERILNILKTDSGTAFCPRVVEAFLAIENRDNLLDQIDKSCDEIESRAREFLTT